MNVQGRILRWPLPLRWRLVAAAVAAATCFAAVFGVLASWRLDVLEDKAVTGALQAQLDLVRSDLAPDGTLGGPSGQVPKSVLAQVIGPGGQLRDSTPALVGVGSLVSLGAVRRAGPRGLQFAVAISRPDLDMALLAVPVHVGATVDGQPAGSGALVVGINSEGFLASRQQLKTLLELGLAAVVAVVGVLTWLLSGRALRAVTSLTEEAEAVSISDLGRGLAVPPGDAELTRLVRALNRMLGRVSRALARQRTFSAHASHQLRTPLALVRGEAELALAGGSPEEMRRALEQVVADADDLSHLVERLLAAAGGERGHVLEPLQVAADDAGDRWQRQCAAAGLPLTVEVRGECLVDAGLLRGTLDPLVDNATHHTAAGGPVGVTLVVESTETLVVTVRDSGTGVDPTVLARLFQPRVTTRADSGGNGLGLWLARETLRASGGELSLLSSGAGGSVFRAEVPVTEGEPAPDRVAPPDAQPAPAGDAAPDAGAVSSASHRCRGVSGRA
jgi:signal transduction histidine kinase